MKTDIARLSWEELLELKEVVDRRVTEVAAQRRSKLLKELKELETAREKASKPKHIPNRKISAKFRHPDGTTWSGGGHTPRWIREHEEKGGSRDDFLVNNPARRPPRK